MALRSLTWWVIGLSIIGTNIGANSYVGAAGNAFTVAIAQANFEWIEKFPNHGTILSLFFYYCGLNKNLDNLFLKTQKTI